MVTIDSTYTGHVSAGSAAQQREVPGARIIKMSVGPMDNNSYLVQCATTGDALLIDAANDADRLIELIDQETPGLVRHIVTTHRHPDHWQALAQVAAATSAETAAHALDATELPVTPTGTLADGDTLTIGRLNFEVIHLTGHTPGSIALALTDGAGRTHLFTGDSLFPGGVGKTRNPQDFATLYADVTAKIFDRYPDDSVVYPGHGDDTTLGAERPHLGEWKERGW
ncbi:MBL fold metallo-hydrolase [Nocardia cyriacigeorgica]|uniref:MBL fold metallo-hydrolase n=1 Tax=Nocardia cyriacigeorgica TaxID=135487 RepID=UPI0013D22617|nr:MBL fold metallo-hydrolase [Nocardia cyriacigeorgica]NEW30289.1 MBL fold metallo-hydrolase [Nocardia cyriacigeorgica]